MRSIIVMLSLFVLISLLGSNPLHAYLITNIHWTSRRQQQISLVHHKTHNIVVYQSTTETDQTSVPSKFQRLDNIKSRLVQLCISSSSSPQQQQQQQRIYDTMIELENTYNEVDGNDSNVDTITRSMYNWMNGEWELLYTPVDITRSSPFFWAFRNAFPDQSNQIYSITDAIPSPIKDVGPAYQEINCQYNNNNNNYNVDCTGTLISRVRVATLGGTATSIMTTRTSIIGINESNDLRLKIETTKPEQSTIVEKLFGPTLGTYMNDNILPAFPSGTVLEQVSPGLSEVTLITTFCDATLRITKNTNNEYFIWKRKSFATNEVL